MTIMNRLKRKSSDNKLPSNGLTAGLKAVLGKLSRGATQGLVSVEQTATFLRIPSRNAALLLGKLYRRGWLARVRRGLYYILPLETESSRQGIASDPWVLASVAFSPCYIGGWSAAEYWGLTEQLFRSTFVATGWSARQKTMNLLNTEFFLVRVSKDRLRNSTDIWRGTSKVAVSDREQTIVDGLLNPTWVGGMRHLIDILRNYGDSSERNLDKLLSDAKRVGKGSALKRLGYLAEKLWPEEKRLIRAARAGVSKGFIKLDPSVKSRGKFVRRWGLWDNIALEENPEQ